MMFCCALDLDSQNHDDVNLPTLGSRAMGLRSFFCVCVCVSDLIFLCGIYMYFAMLTALTLGTTPILSLVELWDIKSFQLYLLIVASLASAIFFILLIFDKQMEPVRNSGLLWILVKCV